MTPLLSIVTGTIDRPESLVRLLHSMQTRTVVQWECIIANAGAEQITVTGLPNITIIPERPRLGFAAGFNVACRQARGKWTLILNDDCEVLPGYDENAIRFMEANPQIGIGALPYSNCGRPFQTNANSFDGMMYANFPIISTELGNQIGWHDEIVRMYGADNSLGFRVLLAGFGIAAVPFNGVIHHEHADAQRVENVKGQHADADRLRAKYEPLLPQMRETYERCRMVTA